MSPIKRTPSGLLCVGLAALFFSLIAQAQSNYLVPDPTGCGITLNNNGAILCSTGLYSNKTFTPFPAGFTGSALSDSGMVAGYTADAHLATYSAGVVTDLGALPGPAQGVYPTAINASGQIAGYMLGPGAVDGIGFFYSNGTITTIGPPSGEFVGTNANGMNDSGQVVGCTTPPPVEQEAFQYVSGTLTNLGPSGCAAAINSSGLIAGYTLDASMFPEPHAAIFLNGKATTLTEPSPFQQHSQAVAINSGGQVVGFMSSSNASSAFFYNGVMNDINSLVSASDPLKSSVTIVNVGAINDGRIMLVSGTSVSGGASYLLQAPWLDVAPGPLTFASQDVGTKSQPQILTLINSGTAPLSLDSISIASGATDFSETNTCPQSLAGGANCTVSVTFSPSKPGDQSTILNVVTAGATITVPLAATAAITITMSVSTNPVNPSVGNMFTITWSATAGSSCQSSGGTANDGWSATTASGSASVIEAQPGVYTYNMTCTAGSVSAAQSLKVTVASQSPSGGGGGGALDLCSLLLIGGLLVMNWQRYSASVGHD